MRRKIKNSVLRAGTLVDAIVCAIAACSMDSRSKLPVILFCLSLGWLVLFFAVNEKHYIKAGGLV